MNRLPVVIHSTISPLSAQGVLAVPNKESDIDVLVDFQEDADLLDLVGLGLFLEERLGRRVDVVPRKALRKEI